MLGLVIRYCFLALLHFCLSLAQLALQDLNLLSDLFNYATLGANKYELDRKLESIVLLNLVLNVGLHTRSTTKGRYEGLGERSPVTVAISNAFARISIMCEALFDIAQTISSHNRKCSFSILNEYGLIDTLAHDQ